MIHRVEFHRELMRLALDSDTNTAFPPATIHLGTPIKDVNFSMDPSVTTYSGEVLGFDLVLATDGIKVRNRELPLQGIHHSGLK
jgi:hypothetical protein